MERYAIKISGPAGMGVMQAGAILGKALNRVGFFSLVYPEYPSRIRGGDNHLQVVFSTESFLSPQEKINFLLAFGKKNLTAHLAELTHDGQAFEAAEYGLEDIARELGNPLTTNTAGLGLLWGVLGLPLAALEKEIQESLSEKEAILTLDLKAVRLGYEKGEIIPEKIKLVGLRQNILSLTGNEALVQGVLAAQCGFAAIYPMTPINSILTDLAKTKVKIFRPEDEIAGIMSAIGAAYAGERALVATSGGGFSLMVEGLGLAGMAEIPVVIILGQRAGPSTGMATFSSQSDLQFAVYAGQGEFPRIVLAPGDLGEAYWLAGEAFNLAERYQVPVILLTDKFLAESRLSVLAEDFKKVKITIDCGKRPQELAHYRRYQITPDGISPRAFPGETVFITNSYEHNEFGFSTDEAAVREEMMAKRGRKLDSLSGGFEIYGPETAKTTLISWGSTKEIILDVLKEFPEMNFLHFWRPWPFPKEASEILRQAKKLVAIEGNFSGQLAGLVEKETGLKSQKILKDNGRPFFREELLSSLRNLSH